ncbi:hypothetical protein MTY_0857 [Moorella thermoacetica Y72]|uniref:Uncharacterized protein n=1 Tax=Moorella thermoacetica Y72 TaxID=1325331 RepID=A0A0S6U935_NEOTH|nr:hypothetical protein MTY_0857 [Moorella thermoacetica Y72]
MLAAGVAFQVDVYLIRVDFSTGVTGGTDDAAPVGVGAEDGTLDQVGTGYGPGHLAGLDLAGRAINLNGYQFTGPFPVTGDEAGQVATDILQPGPEGGMLFNGQGGVAGAAVGQDDCHVVGAGVAVHGHHIKGPIHHHPQGLFQILLFDGSVGGQEAEHGAHIGVDHARPLGDAGNSYRLSPQGQLDGDLFDPGIGGHDGCRRISASLHRQPGGSGLDAGGDFIHRQGHADDAGGGHHHLPWFATDGSGRDYRHLPGVPVTPLPGTGIGIAAVGDNGPGQAGLEVFRRHPQGRRLDPVAGIDGRRRRRHLAHNQSQVQFFLFQTGMNAGGEKTPRGGDAAGNRLEVLRHCLLLHVWNVECLVSCIYGHNPGTSRAMVSGKPHIRLRFCTAWPEAPLVRLSMALATTTRPVRVSTARLRWQLLLPYTQRVWGHWSGGRRWTKGSPA